MYVCNCNGIRCSEVKAVAARCARPADVFKLVGCRPKCGQCLDDMRQHINEAKARAPAPSPTTGRTRKRHEGAQGDH